MSRFLLVSYKPDSHDYCMGCHMASYSSDQQIKMFDDVDELVDAIAILDSLSLDSGEEGYEHQFYTVGETGIEELYFSQEQIDKLHEEKEQMIALVKEQEKAAEKARQELAAKQVEERDKSLLLKLIERYGVPNENH